ncbi:uncharacterized protein BDZ99DRAFT_493561 [Mytilinidion resinicola]|uniref:DUF7730 domain-containing protein n=1 Tax=Mytilinidion resinicola TaxID=574789 RepID=A0A6A6ZB46_9PEZI|nr:uncharacterized protein BDZ99DRAFT_493561 [Mytilinidion resinicola]KAF2817919.1 hypothetical protein BDZ99DRAFT_493561 [Mytilinidion resinicola]
MPIFSRLRIGASESSLPFRPRKTLRKNKKQIELPSVKEPVNECLFLQRLPLELRQEIYRLVLGDATMHLDYSPYRCFSSYECQAPPSCFNGDDTWCSSPCFRKDCVTPRWSRVPLLLSCQQIHSESVDLLYTTSNFCLLVGAAENSFLELTKRLSPRNLNSIRSISIHWAFMNVIDDVFSLGNIVPNPWKRTNWDRLWESIAGMQGLRHLVINLYDSGSKVEWPRDLVEKDHRVFTPLKKRTAPLESFRLIMPHQLAEEVEVGGKVYAVQPWLS